ncbi:MAG: vWA domain-containing protein [Planctomycetota bacterium]
MELIWVHPRVFGFAAVAVVVITLLVLIDRRRRPWWCRWGSVAARALIVAAVAVALAEPRMILPPLDRPVPAPPTDTAVADAVVYLDARVWHDRAAAQHLLSDLAIPVGLVRAGVEAVPLDSPTAWPAGADSTAAAPTATAPALHWLGTDLPRLRALLAPGGARRLVILADAPPDEQQRGWLRRAGLGVEFFPLPAAPELPQPVLGELTFDPPRPEANFPLHIRATAYGPLAGAHWRLMIDGVASAWLPVVPTAAGQLVAPLQAGPLRLPAGSHSVRIELAPKVVQHEPAATATTTVEQHAGLIVREPPSWAVLAESSAAGDAGASWITQLATSAGLRAERSQALPPPGGLAQLSGLIIPIMRLQRMAPADIARLRRYVETGGGLIVPSLTATPPTLDAALVRLLPARPGELMDDPGSRLSVNPEEIDEQVARMTVVFLIDNSGSMAASVGSGYTRSQLVREAVIKSLPPLDPEDRVAVAFFDSTVRGSLGPYKATDANKQKLINEVKLFPTPDFNTSLLAACAEARRLLAYEKSAVRHVVLLSDGEDTVNPEANFAVERERFRALGISCTVVGLGEYSAKLLRMLYTPGSGETFFADPNAGADYYQKTVPQIFFGEVVKARERGEQLRPKPLPDDPKQQRKAGRFLIDKAAPSVTWVRDIDRFPPALRLVRLHPVPGALTVLDVQLDPRVAALLPDRGGAAGGPTPFLVTRRVGLGEVAMIGASLDPTALPDWMEWPAASEFVGGWLRAASHSEPGALRFNQVTWHRLDDPGRAALVCTGRLVPADRTDGGPVWSGAPPVVTAWLAGGLDAGEREARTPAVPTVDATTGALAVVVSSRAAERFTVLELRDNKGVTIAREPLPRSPQGGTGTAAWWQRAMPPNETVAAPAVEPAVPSPVSADAGRHDDLARRSVPLHDLIALLLVIAAALVPLDVFFRR